MSLSRIPRVRAFACAALALLGTAVTVSLAPTAVSAEPFTYTRVSAGYHAACAVTGDGTALCWGWNRNGALGTENRDEKVLTPSRIALPGGARFSSIETGEYATTCGIDTDARVWCWGEHHLGSLFNPTSTRPVQVELPAGTRAAQMSNGGSIACAVTSLRELWCWGDVLDLGNGSTEATRTPERVPMPDGSPVVNVQVGPSNACAVTSAGALWCWGTNDDGEIGLGYRTAKVSLPSRVPLPDGVEVASVSVGLDRVCALSSDGRGFCWGDNYEGAIGDGTYVDSPSPRLVVVPADERLSVLDTAWYHTCAITVSGATWCWGRGGFGELGTGTTLGGRTFRRPALPDGTVLTSLSAGLATTCALDTLSRVWCWTGSDWGVAGTGDATKSLFPRLVAAVGTPTLSTPVIGGVGAERAALQAAVNPQGSPTVWSVQVSTDAAFSEPVTVPGSPAVGAGYSSVAVRTSLGALAPRTRHWARLVARNQFGETTGPSVAFDTLGSEPSVGAPVAGTVSGTRATVGVDVDPGLLRTVVRLEWSDTGDFLSPHTLFLSPVGADDGIVSRSTVLDGLSPRTTYMVRAVATNRLGTTTGTATSFTTAGSVPTITDVSGSAGVLSVTVTAAIDGGDLAGRATASIALADDPSSPLDTVTVRWEEAAPVTARFVFEGLAPRTDYTVSVVASNVLGSRSAEPARFTTRGDAPGVGVAVVSGTATDHADIGVSVNPGGLDARVVVQVSGTEDFSVGVTEHFVAILTGEATVRRTVRVDGLDPRTTYHVRVTATNVLGTTTGTSTMFRTATPVGVIVNDGDPTTITTAVDLAVTPPEGTAALRIANNADMTGARVLAPAPTVRWQLEPAGAASETRTVWVQFLDRNGRLISSASDSIDLVGDESDAQPDSADDSAPVLSSARFTTASASAAGRGAGPRVTVAGRDVLSGIVRVEFRSGRKITAHRFGSVTTLRQSFAVPTRSSLWVRLVDAAGNTSRWVRVRGS